MQSVQDLLLGSGHKRQYSPQEQAAFSAKFPSLVWKDGVPYTQAPEPGFDPNDPYAYQSGADTGALTAATQNQPGGLVEANLDDPNIWRQLGGLAAGTSLGELGASFLPGAQGGAGDFSFTGGGGGSVGGYSTATAAPSLSVPSMSAALPGVAPMSLSAPAASIGGSAALGGGSAATSIAGGSAALPASAAAPAAGWTAPAAATGWRSWLPKVKDLLPIGADIYRGVTANNALNKANEESQAATDKALKINQGALETAGNVYQQQRQDTQNLANVPYQTLGQLMGINIPNIGPASNVVTSASPTGMPTGLVPANQTRPLGVNDPWQGPAQGALTPYRGATLAQLSQAIPVAARKSVSRSGYDPRRA